MMIRHEPVIVGILPDSPYISRNYVWRYRRLRGWRIVKLVRDGPGLYPPRYGWLGVLLGWHR